MPRTASTVLIVGAGIAGPALAFWHTANHLGLQDRQVVLDSWAHGRVVLLGDAGFFPEPVATPV